MTVLELWFAGVVPVMLMMIGIWLVSLVRRDASIVDVMWGGGFAIVAWCYAILSPAGDPTRQMLLLVLVTVWAVRLGAYLTWRNWGKGEDPRYAAWRQQHGARYWWVSFFQVYLLQGSLMWLISAPLAWAVHTPQPPALTGWDALGALVWAVGLFFESVSDWQLAQFKANPANKGKVLNTGLWRYTRHPNYFGDACVWWGFGLLAVNAPWGWLTLLAPALMTFLLMRVSGVTLLESRLRDHKPGYADYIARTSAFFPLPPKKS